MTIRACKMITALIAAAAISGCLFAQEGKLLRAPFGTKQEAARHNDEGIQAYNQGQKEVAKQHFEAAVKIAPSPAEAHYNLGMLLYRQGKDAEAKPHFLKAAALAPGNEVIGSSPPLSSVQKPSKSQVSPRASDGHSH